MDKEYMRIKMLNLLNDSIFSETGIANMLFTTGHTLKNLLNGLPVKFEQKNWENIELFIKCVVLPLEEVAQELANTPVRHTLKRIALHQRRIDLMNMNFLALKK